MPFKHPKFSRNNYKDIKGRIIEPPAELSAERKVASFSNQYSLSAARYYHGHNMRLLAKQSEKWNEIYQDYENLALTADTPTFQKKYQSLQ